MLRRRGCFWGERFERCVGDRDAVASDLRNLAMSLASFFACHVSKQPQFSSSAAQTSHAVVLKTSYRRHVSTSAHPRRDMREHPALL